MLTALKVFVKDVQKAPNGQNLHKVVVEAGTLTKDAAVKAVIDTKKRSSDCEKPYSNSLTAPSIKRCTWNAC